MRGASVSRSHSVTCPCVPAENKRSPHHAMLVIERSLCPMIRCRAKRSSITSRERSSLGGAPAARAIPRREPKFQCQRLPWPQRGACLRCERCENTITVVRQWRQAVLTFWAEPGDMDSLGHPLDEPTPVDGDCSL